MIWLRKKGGFVLPNAPSYRRCDGAGGANSLPTGKTTANSRDAVPMWSSPTWICVQLLWLIGNFVLTEQGFSFPEQRMVWPNREFAGSLRGVFRSTGITRRVRKGALWPCPRGSQRLDRVGTLRFAHPASDCRLIGTCPNAYRPIIGLLSDLSTPDVIRARTCGRAARADRPH